MGKPNAGASRLYGRRWRRVRALFLQQQPLCVMCQADGRLTPATEVDHIEQHGNNPRRFYDTDNLQPLCADHHRSYKAKQERSGNTAVPLPCLI